VLCVAEDQNSKESWHLNCNALELNMMLENFYTNAVEHSASYLQFNFKKDMLELTSNSTQITPDNFERVFELGFSTKANGTGVGLNQIKTFLKDKCNLKIKALNRDNEVCFQIYK
jgi:signal transduction histidine kinase